MIDLGPTLSIPAEIGHYVYRHLDADGLVLYVGRTSNPAQRTANNQLNGNGSKLPARPCSGSGS